MDALPQSPASAIRPRRSCQLAAALLVVSLLAPCSATDPFVQTPGPVRPPQLSPAAAGMSAERLQVIEQMVELEIQRERMPGCVVLIGRREGVVYRRAFGLRQLKPTELPMTEDTVFDLASLTKPVATATSVMILVDRGKLSLDETAAHYWPEFGVNGKGVITIRQLLTHTSGLIPDNPMADYSGSPSESFARIAALSLSAPPGEQFIYSDVGFLVLGHIVERISGSSLNEFVHAEICQPLGLAETGYLPSPQLSQRAATTQERDGKWMQGQVHDPRAWALGGVAGHAGLFSTADDLSVYATMMLNQGRQQQTQLLSQKTWELFTTGIEVPRGRRAPGWDSLSPYSSNRGDLMSDHAFGHGGFTGTGIWIDPQQNLYVIFLSNRVHPDGNGSVNSLIGRIGTVAGAAIPASESR